MTADGRLDALALRDYQRDAITAVHRAWAGEQRGTGVGVANRVAVVLATGLGKTVIFAHPDFRRPILARRPGSRMLVLVHRDELAAQAVAKVHSIDPSTRVGRVQAGHDDVDAEVIVASVQTLARESRRARVRDVGLIVVDEAHHATARSHVDVLRYFGAFDDTPTAGFSATLGRGDDGKLGDVWQEVVIRRDIVDGIRGGHLVDVRGVRVQVQGLDLSRVRRVAGDLSESDVAHALDDAQAPEQVASAYALHAQGRQGVAFWPDVATATAGAQAMTDAGMPSAVVTGATPISERAAIFSDLRAGRLVCVHNCMVLTEGWDCPQVSCACIVRPTQSAPLYVQMAGRVLRPHRGPIVPGFSRKTDALLLDFVGTAGRHKLATIADLSITTTLKRESLSEGASLLDAVDDAERDERVAESAEGVEEPLRPTGPLVVEELDLFASSAMTWMQTRLGTWFLPAGQHLVFLWPEPGGLWTLGQAGNGAAPGTARPLASGLTMDLAMAHGESRAAALEAESGGASAVLSRKSASWRQRRAAPASERQIAFARSLGIVVTDGVSKVDLSDMISAARASRTLGG